MSLEIICLLVFVFSTITWISLKLDYRIPIGIGIMLIVATFVSIAIVGGAERVHQISMFAYCFLLSGTISCLADYFRSARR